MPYMTANFNNLLLNVVYMNHMPNAQTLQLKFCVKILIYWLLLSHMVSSVPVYRKAYRLWKTVEALSFEIDHLYHCYGNV